MVARGLSTPCVPLYFLTISVVVEVIQRMVKKSGVFFSLVWENREEITWFAGRYVAHLKMTVGRDLEFWCPKLLPWG